MQEVSELKETEQRKILILEMDFAQNGGESSSRDAALEDATRS